MLNTITKGADEDEGG